MTAHSFFQHLAIFLHVILFRVRRNLLCKAQIPILPYAHLAVLVKLERVARHKFKNFLVGGFPPREIAKRKIFRKCCTMELGFHAGMRQNHFYFRTENKRIGSRSIVKRLYPQPVARNKQPPLARIPNRERKHPTQMLNTVAPVLFVEMNDSFGIAMCAITMSSRL